MYISINRVGLTHKPGPGFDWQAYNNGFVNDDIDIIDLVGHICRGDSFAGVFDGKRSLANFKLAQHIAVDMDAGNDTSSLASLLNHPFTQAYACIVYPTLSSTPESPRHRVVFALDAPILGEMPYRVAVETVYNLYPGSDPACIDPSRNFFGNGNITLQGLDTYYDDKVLPLEDLRLYARQMLEARRTPPPTQPSQPAHQQRDVMPAGEFFDRLQRIDPYAMDYSAWLKLCAAIAHTYGEGEWTYWQVKRWSDRPGKQPLSLGKWKSIAASHSRPAAYGTILYTLKQYGIAA